MCLVNCYRQNGSQLFESVIFFLCVTMACISLNRACTRVVQDKLYQLLINKNRNQIYRQSRNHFNGATGSVILTNRNNFNDIGFNSIARNLSGTKQVNNQSSKQTNSNPFRSTERFLFWSMPWKIGKIETDIQ